MLFVYHAVDADGHEREGTIEAPSQEVAITALQRRTLVISSISEAGKKAGLSMTDTRIPYTEERRVDDKGKPYQAVIIDRQYLEYEHHRRYQERSEAYGKADFDSLVKSTFDAKVVPDVKSRQAGEATYESTKTPKGLPF